LSAFIYGSSRSSVLCLHRTKFVWQLLDTTETVQYEVGNLAGVWMCVCVCVYV